MLHQSSVAGTVKKPGNRNFSRTYIPKKNRNFTLHMTEEFFGGSLFYVCKLCPYARTDASQVRRHAWARHMQRAIGTQCYSLLPDSKPDTNESLDSGLRHLVKGLPIPLDVTIPNSILDRFAEGQSFFACKHCTYVGDRRTHARNHVLRIHVRGSTAMKGKRKFLCDGGSSKQKEQELQLPPVPESMQQQLQPQTNRSVPDRLQLPDGIKCFFLGEWNHGCCEAARAVADGRVPPLQRHQQGIDDSSSSSSRTKEDELAYNDEFMGMYWSSV